MGWTMVRQQHLAMFRVLMVGFGRTNRSNQGLWDSNKCLFHLNYRYNHNRSGNTKNVKEIASTDDLKTEKDTRSNLDSRLVDDNQENSSNKGVSNILRSIINGDMDSYLETNDKSNRIELNPTLKAASNTQKPLDTQKNIIQKEQDSRRDKILEQYRNIIYDVSIGLQNSSFEDFFNQFSIFLQDAETILDKFHAEFKIPSRPLIETYIESSKKFPKSRINYLVDAQRCFIKYYMKEISWRNNHFADPQLFYEILDGQNAPFVLNDLVQYENQSKNIYMPKSFHNIAISKVIEYHDKIAESYFMQNKSLPIDVLDKILINIEMIQTAMGLSDNDIKRLHKPLEENADIVVKSYLTILPTATSKPYEKASINGTWKAFKSLTSRSIFVKRINEDILYTILAVFYAHRDFNKFNEVENWIEKSSNPVSENAKIYEIRVKAALQTDIKKVLNLLIKLHSHNKKLDYDTYSYILKDARSTGDLKLCLTLLKEIPMKDAPLKLYDSAIRIMLDSGHYYEALKYFRISSFIHDRPWRPETSLNYNYYRRMNRIEKEMAEKDPKFKPSSLNKKIYIVDKKINNLDKSVIYLHPLSQLLTESIHRLERSAINDIVRYVIKNSNDYNEEDIMKISRILLDGNYPGLAALVLRGWMELGNKIPGFVYTYVQNKLFAAKNYISAWRFHVVSIYGNNVITEGMMKKEINWVPVKIYIILNNLKSSCPFDGKYSNNTNKTMTLKERDILREIKNRNIKYPWIPLAYTEFSELSFPYKIRKILNNYVDKDLNKSRDKIIDEDLTGDGIDTGDNNNDSKVYSLLWKSPSQFQFNKDTLNNLKFTNKNNSLCDYNGLYIIDKLKEKNNNYNDSNIKKLLASNVDKDSLSKNLDRELLNKNYDISFQIFLVLLQKFPDYAILYKSIHSLKQYSNYVIKNKLDFIPLIYILQACYEYDNSRKINSDSTKFLTEWLMVSYSLWDPFVLAISTLLKSNNEKDRNLGIYVINAIKDWSIKLKDPSFSINLFRLLWSLNEKELVDDSLQDLYIKSLCELESWKSIVKVSPIIILTELINDKSCPINWNEKRICYILESLRDNITNTKDYHRFKKNVLPVLLNSNGETSWRSSYAQLLVASELGNITSAKDVWVNSYNNNLKLDIKCYEPLLLTLINNRKYKEAYKIFQIMKNGKIEISNRTLSIAVIKHSKDLQCHYGIEYLKTLSESAINFGHGDISLKTDIMKNYLLFSTLKEDFELTKEIYICFFNCGFKRERIKAVLEDLFLQLYSTNNMEIADQLFFFIGYNRKSIWTKKIYELMVNYYCYIGNLSRFLNTVETSTELEYHKTFKFKTYENMIKMFLYRGSNTDMQFARRFWNVLCEKLQYSPSSEIAQLMVIRHSQTWHLEEAETYLGSIINLGMPYDVTLFNYIIKGWSIRGRFDRCERLIDFIRRYNLIPNRETWIYVLVSYIKGFQKSKIEKCLIRMQTSGYSCTPLLSQKLMDECDYFTEEEVIRQLVEDNTFWVGSKSLNPEIRNAIRMYSDKDDNIRSSQIYSYKGMISKIVSHGGEVIGDRHHDKELNPRMKKREWLQHLKGESPEGDTGLMRPLRLLGNQMQVLNENIHLPAMNTTHNKRLTKLYKGPFRPKLIQESISPDEDF